jgi:hypothetical protein
MSAKNMHNLANANAKIQHDIIIDSFIESDSPLGAEPFVLSPAVKIYEG